MNAIATWRGNVRISVSLRHVLILALAVRLLLPLLAVIITDGNPQFYARDTNSYIRPAIALISYGSFASNAEPEIIRTPGYPLFLIPGIASGHVEAVTIILQIVVSAFTVFLVFRISLLLFERTGIAILCALLYAIEPVSILYSSKLLSETLFTALITLFLYFMLSYWKGGSLIHLVVSATALAASVYVRPIAYYLPIIVSIILFVGMLAKWSKNQLKAVHIGLFFLISVSLVGVWQIRNKNLTGYPGFSAASEQSLYFYDAASVLAVANAVPIDDMMEQMGFYDEEVYFRNFPDQREWERGDINRSMGKAGLEIILGNAGTYSILVLRGIVRTLLDPGATEFLRMFRLYPEAGGLLDLIVEQGLVSVAEFLYKEMPIVFWANLLLVPMMVLYLFLAIISVVQSRITHSIPVALLSGVAAYFLVLSATGIGTNRARHPIMPIICVLAGYGLFHVISTIGRNRSLHRAKLIPATEECSLPTTLDGGGQSYGNASTTSQLRICGQSSLWLRRIFALICTVLRRTDLER